MDRGFPLKTIGHFKMTDLMQRAARNQEYANDNLWIEVDQKKVRIPDGWQNYDRVEMGCFGPMGFNSAGFVYLDGER